MRPCASVSTLIYSECLYLYHTKFESNIKEFQYFSLIKSHLFEMAWETKMKMKMRKKNCMRESREIDRRCGMSGKWYDTYEILKIIQGFDLRSPHRISCAADARRPPHARNNTILSRSNQIPNTINLDVTHNVTNKSKNIVIKLDKAYSLIAVNKWDRDKIKYNTYVYGTYMYV